MKNIIRFQIPEVSNSFLIYIRDRMRNGDLSIIIFEDFLNKIISLDIDSSLGNKVESDPIENEFSHFKNLGYGLCEIQIIFWQGILQAGYMRMNEMFEND